MNFQVASKRIIMVFEAIKQIKSAGEELGVSFNCREDMTAACIFVYFEYELQTLRPMKRKTVMYF